MSLESILERILNKAELDKGRIIQEAKIQAEGIISEAKKEADALYKGILAKEKLSQENQKQKLIVNVRLEGRKNLLKAKQESIDQVLENFKSALKKDKLKKQQVSTGGIKEVPEDIDFYLDKFRQDYETQIANMLF